jgi:hypothetical protein
MMRLVKKGWAILLTNGIPGHRPCLVEMICGSWMTLICAIMLYAIVWGAFALGGGQ